MVSSLYPTVQSHGVPDNVFLVYAMWPGCVAHGELRIVLCMLIGLRSLNSLLCTGVGAASFRVF